MTLALWFVGNFLPLITLGRNQQWLIGQPAYLQLYIFTTQEEKRFTTQKTLRQVNLNIMHPEMKSHIRVSNLFLSSEDQSIYSNYNLCLGLRVIN